MLISRLVRGIIEASEKEIIFDRECDVLCVGAGCAGVYAADSAAREGAKVILVENDLSVGGMHVHGNVKGYYYGAPGGAFEEDDEKCRADKAYHLSAFIQKKQFCQLERLKQSGVCLLTAHTPTGVIIDSERVVGIAAFNGEKEVYIRGKITVDATSDGHLIRMIDSVKTDYGRDIDGKSAPFSVFATYIDSDGKCKRINADAGHLNPYDSCEFSKKTIYAHSKAREYLSMGEFLNLASHTGVREGVRFEGEETLSYDDILLGRLPEKVLFYAYSDFDRHGHDHALDEELYQSFWVISNLATVTVRMPVPFGAVIPKGVSGIVTAGRCFSTDTYAQGAVRMIRDMFRMGECVGIAAAMAAACDCDFSKIDYAEYQKRARLHGAFAGEEEKSFGFAFPKVNTPYTPIDFKNINNLELLKTETPGIAIWTAFLSDDDSLSYRLCTEMLNTEDKLYKYNLAIALGIMSDVRALPVLREILKMRDCFYFKDCRRSNQFRSAIAACLIGRLGDTEDIPELESIVFDPDEYLRDMYHTLPPDYLYYKGSDRNFVYFNMFTHCAAALVKIYKRCEIPTETLTKRFEELLSDGKVIERIANGRTDGVTYDETLGFITRMICETKA